MTKKKLFMIKFIFFLNQSLGGMHNFEYFACVYCVYNIWIGNENEFSVFYCLFFSTQICYLRSKSFNFEERFYPTFSFLLFWSFYFPLELGFYNSISQFIKFLKIVFCHLRSSCCPWLKTYVGFNTLIVNTL